MYNRAQLKQEVKQTIAATKPRPMWVALLYLVIASIGASLIQSILGSLAGTSFLSSMLSDLMMSGKDIEEAIGELLLVYADRIVSFVGTLITTSLLSSILITLWQGLMNVGFNGYCLSLVREEKPAVGKIFCGFSLFGKVILTSLLVWVFTTLWTLLWAVCLIVVVAVAALLMEAVPVVGVLLILVGYIGFIVLILWTYFRYAMTNYILLDTGKCGLEAISESKRMMKGRKWKFFVLQLSFIGWYLLLYAVILIGSIILGVVIGVGSAGIATGITSIGAIGGMVGGSVFVLILMLAVVYLINIWLQPYITGSVAKFYLFFKPQEPAAESAWPTLGDTTTTVSEEPTDSE